MTEQISALAREEAGLPLPERYVAILALCLGTMTTSVDNGAISIALPALAADLGIAPSRAVTLVTIFQMVMIMGVVPLSALGDRLGHRRMYQGGQGLFLFATLACCFIRDFHLLLLLRGIQAVGASAIFSVSSGLVRAVYPSARLGSGLALNTLIASTSASVAPTIAGIVLTWATWPYIFALTVPLAGLSMVAGARSLPRSARHDDPFDTLGAAMFALTMGLVVFALQDVSHAGLSWTPVLLAGCAATAGTAFVMRELRRPRPVLPLDLLASPPLAAAAAGATLANGAAMCVLLTLPFRLQHDLDFSSATTGLVIAAWPAAMMLAAPLFSLLSDRLPAGPICLAGMTLGTMGMIALWLLPAHPGQWEVAWRLFIAAGGFGMFYAPNARFFVGSVPRSRAAAAGALSQTNRLAGQILGSTAAAAFLSSGKSGSAPIAAALIAAVVGLTTLLMRPMPSVPEGPHVA